MYIERVPNRNSPPAVLLRESYREGGKVRKRTLANLSKWPDELVEGLRILLKGGVALPSMDDAFEILRSRPHGHVAAVLGTLRALGLEKLLDRRPSRERALAVAMIVARVLDPRSKLATARSLGGETMSHTLGGELGVEDADADELYRAMDWLLRRRDRIERHLAGRRLADGSLVLCDVTSTYFEGRKCPLARRGYSRDGKRGKLQIVFALLCDGEGCPVAVEVFEGNTADPGVVGAQVAKLRERFSLSRIVLVGDRGLITGARIREELRPAGLGWITALRADAIRKLAGGGDLQLSLFDERNLAEIESPDYPGERLVACRNPLLAAERARKREELLEATERELEKVAAATRRERSPLTDPEKIAVRADRALRSRKVGKHFDTEVAGDGRFAYARNEERIAAEAALDGIYVIRTNVPADELPAGDVVRSYKSLSRVERAFRSFKSVDLKVRPVHHRLEGRVRAHVFLCMLAYYVEWHMRRALAPLLFDDDDPDAAEAQRASPVAPARPSPAARAKAARKRTPEGLPVHSFRTLLADLATLTKNRVRPVAPGAPAADILARPTPLQAEAFRLLGVKP
ncbi:IS1634 family transposase [Candidatus Palauibacter sp.]|uniref:IS1634 family transposase n=1 Tax=Candidatus Palauibacter sp. TaxID=3101350 RepID=UPI003AF2E491